MGAKPLDSCYSCTQWPSNLKNVAYSTLGGSIILDITFWFQGQCREELFI